MNDLVEWRAQPERGSRATLGRKSDLRRGITLREEGRAATWSWKSAHRAPKKWEGIQVLQLWALGAQ